MKKTNFLKSLAAVVLAGCMFTSCEKEDLSATFQAGPAEVKLTVTVEDALTEASVQLGTTSDKIEYEVVEKGSTGFLVIGSKDAVIKVRLKASTQDLVKEFLSSVFDAMKMVQ